MSRPFRDISSWLLFVGIAVSFFAFLNAERIYNNVQHALDEANGYRYKYTFQLGVNTSGNHSVLPEIINELPGTVSAPGSLVYIDELDSYMKSDVLLKQDGRLPWTIDEIDASGKVYVGKKLYEKCSAEGNTGGLKVNGKGVPVKGVICSEKLDTFNYKLVFLQGSDQYEETLQFDSLMLEIGSNREDSEIEIQNVMEHYHEMADFYFDRTVSDYIEIGRPDVDESFYNVIALFSIINSIVISEFWVMKRKKEILIRRLYGFSLIRIFLLIYRKILLIAVSSVAVVFVVESIYSLIVEGEWDASLDQVVASLIFVVVSSVVISALPIYMASRYKIGDGTEVI